MRGSSDQQLVRAALAGNPDAASELLGRHMKASWGAAYAILGRTDLADDATQDAFERAIRHLDRFDSRREFRPWLHRIVVNCAVNVIHARKRRREETLDEQTRPIHDREPFEAADSALEVIQALAGIDVDRRIVVVLRLVMGYSPEEVADLLDTPVGTVHSRLSRGLSDLRGRMEVLDGP